MVVLQNELQRLCLVAASLLVVQQVRETERRSGGGSHARPLWSTYSMRCLLCLAVQRLPANSVQVGSTCVPLPACCHGEAQELIPPICSPRAF